MKKYLITGGSGFIGKKLVEKLSEEGASVTVLTRQSRFKSSAFVKYIHNLDEHDFDYDVVINLQGESISQRWTKAKKEKIVSSRIEITKKIVEKINSSKSPPSLFISGSAIGYYGTSDTLVFLENSQKTSQSLFSQNLCSKWEESAMLAKTRVVLLRTSVVIGKNGGILQKMLLPFSLGLGGKIGSGKQYLSWVQIDDAVRAIIFLIENKNMKGAVNISSPNFVTNFEFSKSLARALKRPCLFSIPTFVAKLLYGKMAEELLLNGQKVYPQALLEAGFSFQCKKLDEAIKRSI
jgi:uncharacterized protein (TIGR01777 family)